MTKSITQTPTLTIHLLTLFPEFFVSPLGTSMIKRAAEKNLVKYHVVDIRQFAVDKQRVTDDRPFGGGPGMVMKVEPIVLALESLQLNSPMVILTSARGSNFTQSDAWRYSLLNDLVIICGHYEGVDQRVADHFTTEEKCIGEYVLSGGESAGLVMLDAVTRLVPGVLGNELSNQAESHSQPGALGSVQYTRPETFRDLDVPRVLLEGNHKLIAEWRKKTVL